MSDRVSPASVLLIHGAGSGPWIFAEWPSDFASLRVGTVDLHAGVDVARASMGEYAARVVAAARELPQPVALCGWSMGGLVALLAADRVRPHSIILLEASPPAETQGSELDAPTLAGTFDPEAAYGPFPAGIPSRPESSLARAERKRGISVPSLRCPSLVVYGDTFREERGRQVARLYGSDERYFPGLDHWDLVRDRRVRQAIASYLGAFQPTGVM